MKKDAKTKQRPTTLTSQWTRPAGEPDYLIDYRATPRTLYQVPHEVVTFL